MAKDAMQYDDGYVCVKKVPINTLPDIYAGERGAEDREPDADDMKAKGQ